MALKLTIYISNDNVAKRYKELKKAENKTHAELIASMVCAESAQYLKRMQEMEAMSVKRRVKR